MEAPGMLKEIRVVATDLGKHCPESLFAGQGWPSSTILSVLLFSEETAEKDQLLVSIQTGRKRNIQAISPARSSISRTFFAKNESGDVN